MTLYPKLILDALATVRYPGTGKNLVEAEMVADNLRIDGMTVSFSLIFEKPTDPFMKSMLKAAETAIHTYVSPDVQVTITAESKQAARPEVGKLLPQVKNIVGISSGKGGVGKSMVTSLLAAASMREGFKTAILDGDITGPSIPKAFGLSMNLVGNAEGLILPATTTCGIDIVSVNLMLANETDPVIWRGPVIAGVVTQFWTDVMWGDLDFLFVDMPPGTGDVPLTVFQSLPVDGVVIVTSPQDLVQMIVEKAYNMAKKMNIPVLGLVENYSYLECPDCGKKISVFGESHIDEIAEKLGVEVLGKMPIDPKLAEIVEQEKFYEADNQYLKNIIDKFN